MQLNKMMTYTVICYLILDRHIDRVCHLNALDFRE